MHHAILLHGKKGIGKSSFAKDFVNQITGTIPNNPDLLFIKKNDGKRDIVVDQIREIADFVNRTAAISKSKFIIIDAADDLNKSGANALLKILEEPHKNNFLILISHLPGKLLPTIRSRCQAIQVADLVKEHFPNLKVVARASTRPDAWEFMHRDIPVVRELFEGGLELGEKAMLALGCRPYVVKKLANRFRTIDAKLMEESAKLRGDTRSLVSLAKVQREALVRLMEADEDQIKSNPSTGWAFSTDSDGEGLATSAPLKS